LAENIYAEAERFERLAKSVSDRELAQYYAERAKALRKSETPERAGRRIAAEVVKENQPLKRTTNKVVNETARQGLLANAEAAEREAAEWDRKAEEKLSAVRRVSDRTLVNYYSESAREMRAHAELARSRASAFRNAAASLA
jgi:hypothetical protein